MAQPSQPRVVANEATGQLFYAYPPTSPSGSWQFTPVPPHEYARANLIHQAEVLSGEKADLGQGNLNQPFLGPGANLGGLGQAVASLPGNIMAQAQGPFSPEVNQAIITAADAHGVSRAAMFALAQVESGGQNIPGRSSSAAGVFQIMPDTATEWGVDPWDVAAAADATARNMAANAARVERALGREATAGELYMMHQQGGAGGLRAIIAAERNPNVSAASVLGARFANANGGQGRTIGQMVGRWTNEIEQAATEFAEGFPEVVTNIGRGLVQGIAGQWQRDARHAQERLTPDESRRVTDQMANPSLQSLFGNLFGTPAPGAPLTLTPPDTRPLGTRADDQLPPTAYRADDQLPPMGLRGDDVMPALDPARFQGAGLDIGGLLPGAPFTPGWQNLPSGSMVPPATGYGIPSAQMASNPPPAPPPEAGLAPSAYDPFATPSSWGPIGGPQYASVPAPQQAPVEAPQEPRGMFDAARFDGAPQQDALGIALQDYGASTAAIPATLEQSLNAIPVDMQNQAPAGQSLASPFMTPGQVVSDRMMSNQGFRDALVNGTNVPGSHGWAPTGYGWEPPTSVPAAPPVATPEIQATPARVEVPIPAPSPEPEAPPSPVAPVAPIGPAGTQQGGYVSNPSGEDLSGLSIGAPSVETPSVARGVGIDVAPTSGTNFGHYGAAGGTPRSTANPNVGSPVYSPSSVQTIMGGHSMVPPAQAGLPAGVMSLTPSMFSSNISDTLFNNAVAAGLGPPAPGMVYGYGAFSPNGLIQTTTQHATPNYGGWDPTIPLSGSGNIFTAYDTNWNAPWGGFMGGFNDFFGGFGVNGGNGGPSWADTMSDSQGWGPF